MGEDEGGMSWIIVAIVALVVIAISLTIIVKMYPQALGFLPASWRSMNTETQQQNEDNFDKMTADLEACRNVNDYDCVCNIMPNFPGSFNKELELTFFTEGRKLVISLNRFNKKMKDSILNDMNIQISKIDENLAIEFQNTNVVTLQFNKNYPFEKNKKQFIISEGIFKKDIDNGFFLSIQNVNDAQNIIEKTQKIPLCQDKRMDAIKEFENIKVLIESASDQEFIVSLPSGYSIRYDSSTMKLEKDDKTVVKINYERSDNKDIIKTSGVIYTKQGISCDGQENILRTGQKILVKSQNNGCISTIN